VQAALQHRYGEGASVYVIGPAGENLCRNAVIMHETGHAFGGTVGFGAVMGAKNLKAIVARGTGSLKVARPKELLDIWYRFSREVSRREDEPETKPRARRIEFCKFKPDDGLKVVDLEKLGQLRISHSSCHLCPVGCLQTFSYNDGSLPAIATKCHNYSNYRVMEAKYYGKEHNMGNTTVLSAGLFNDLGIDAYVPSGLVDMLVWMKSAGIITSGNTGLDLDKIGSKEFISDLLPKIAYRQGIGDKLAEGQYRFLASWKNEKADAISRQMRNRKGNVCTTMGGKVFAYFDKPFYVVTSKAHVIMNLTDVRGYINYDYVWNGPEKLVSVDAKPGTPEYRELKNRAARRWFGTELAIDESTWDKKIDVALFLQRFLMLESSSTYCEWIFPRFYSNYTEDKMGTLDMPARFWSAITGVDTTYEQLEKRGERLQTLERAITVREGRTREHDWFFDDYFKDNHWTEKDKEDLRKVMDEYYHRVGWDKKTGWPTRETLKALDLKDIAEELGKMGKLP
jgi:aldehyde:ferredoxin oxidoreductase